MAREAILFGSAMVAPYTRDKQREKLNEGGIGNGSPKKNGTTSVALAEVGKTLATDGVDTVDFHIGAKPISGCIDCRKCMETGRCIIPDAVSEFRAIADAVDGYIFGTPVHFAAPTGALVSFLDRLFFSSRFAAEQPFYLKPAASVIVARRAGTTATFDQMNKYFALLEMPIIPSGYWNMAFGMTPDEARIDSEGMQIMRNIARNMAWFLRCKEVGLTTGVPLPKRPRIDQFHQLIESQPCFPK